MNNLTAKEKAILLVSKYYNLESEGDKGGWMTFNDAKQCALIAVDEIIEILWHTHKNEIEYRYYKEIKQEIEKL
jgi:hypothetical protein